MNTTSAEGPGTRRSSSRPVVGALASLRGRAKTKPWLGRLALVVALVALWAAARLDLLPFVVTGVALALGLNWWRRSLKPTPRFEHQPETEEALRQSEDRFRSSFDNAPIGMALISPDSGYVQVNSAFCDMVGRSEEELIGTWAHDITHPDEKEPDRERWQRMLSGEVDQDTAEKRYIHADGHTVWVRVSMSAIREPDGTMAYAIVQAVDLTESRRAERAIRNSEKRFRSSFDKAPIGMALISPDSGYMQVNSAFCDMVGRSEEELIGGWAHDITHPDDLDKDQEGWQLMVSGKTDTDSVEKRYIHADGHTVWARVDLSAVRHTDGSLAYAIVQAVDQTGRKEAEAALQESEDRFRSAFDHAPIGVALISPEGGRLQVNQALCEMLGRSEEELLGGWAVEITHPDDMEANAEMWQRLVTGEADNVRFEKRYIHADGHTIWAYIDAGAIRNSDGSLAYGIVQTVDLTSRKEAEVALQESEERFRSAFDKAPIGMALVSADNGYLRVNQALCEILGRAEEELLSTWPHKYTHPDDLDQDTENWPRLISNEIDRYSFEKRYIHAEGHTIWVYVDAGAVHDNEGHFAHAIVQVVDITARKHAEERLQQLIASKDQFVASVSHELRTPLTAVIGLAHELRDNWEAFSSEESQELASLIADQSTEVGHIVEDLLVAARADIGEVAVFPQNIDLLPTVAETIHSLSLDGSHVALPSNTAKAWADPTRLRQILRNLVTNAVRYGGDEITIGIVEDTDRVFLEVSDESDGIPEDQRELIFDAYHNTGKAEGLTASVGLGLTISRKLARLMGGDLSYRYEDGWSKFVVDLPVADKSDSAN